MPEDHEEGPEELLGQSLDRVGDSVEDGLLPNDLDALAGARGLDALRVPAELLDEELPGKSGLHRLIEIGVSFAAVAALFAFALPQITGAEYQEVWATFAGVSAVGLAIVVAVWLAVMWTYTYFLTTSLPGLRNTQALVVNFAGSALANVVPFGGAAGVGATYAMTRSWGFDVPSITRSIVVSGFWNIFAKLAIPVAALALLGLSGQATEELMIASAVGLVALVAMVATFGLVLHSDALAKGVGGLGEGMTSVVLAILRRPAVSGFGDRLVRFRHESVELIRARWLRLTVWMAVYTLGQFLLLLLCVRLLGAETASLGWIEAFAAFAFNRLLTTIPLTPSGVGFAETGTVAMLTAFGAATNPAAAAVLLYSTFTYLLEIPIGAMGWAAWAGMKRWRRPTSPPGSGSHARS